MIAKTMEINKRNEKFKQMANIKIKKVITDLNKMIKASETNRYEIFDIDAQKILNAIVPTLNGFIDRYTEISKNEFAKREKIIVPNIF